MGQVISELEELGHVERRIDPSDRPAKAVHYASKGLQMSADAREIGEEIVATIRTAHVRATESTAFGRCAGAGARGPVSICRLTLDCAARAGNLGEVCFTL